MTEPVEVTTNMAPSLAPQSAKSASSKGKGEEGHGVEVQESDGKGQESDDQTKQSEVKTLSEPSKSVGRVCSLFLLQKWFVLSICKGHMKNT